MRILLIFLNYGYLRISPPLIEFEETLLNQGPGLALKIIHLELWILFQKNDGSKV